MKAELPSSQAARKSRWVYFVALSLLCLPLFYINVRDSHSWGDDFAGYIHQAANIVEGRPQSETGFVYNEKLNDISVIPNSGFPLLLSPAYAFFGNDVKSFQHLISFFLFGLCLVLMVFYNRYFSPLVSLLLVLVLVYNPWILEFKSEILSDVPFAFFLFLTFVIFLPHGLASTPLSLLAGLMAGWLISIRTVGFTFPVALSIYLALEMFFSGSKAQRKTLLKNYAIAMGGMFAVYLLLNKFVFSIPDQGYYVSSRELTPGHLWEQLLSNVRNYTQFLDTFFRDLGRYNFLKVIALGSALLFFSLGIFISIRKRPGFIAIFSCVYLVTILLIAGCNFRYLLPLLPVFFFYIAAGLAVVKWKWKRGKNLVSVLPAVFLLVQYYPEVKWILAHQHATKNGPQEPASLDAFNYLRNNTAPDAVIVFDKPRALSLYTGRPSMAIQPTDNMEEVTATLQKKNVGYILTHTEVTRDSTILHYIRSKKDGVMKEWGNEKFSLYRVN